MKPKRYAIYVRVSTQEQDLSRQWDDLISYVGNSGGEFVKKYEDKLTGSNTKRPGLQEMLLDARKRKFDIVLVWSIDRLGRNVKDLVLTLDDFKNRGIGLISYTQGIDTTGPFGEAMYTMLSAVAQMEHTGIKDRVSSGVRRAMKMRGGVWGKKMISKHKYKLMYDLFRDEGNTNYFISKGVGVSQPTVAKYREIAKTKSPKQYNNEFDRRESLRKKK